MDCDQVFLSLTAGPFPSGRATDAEVELHLVGCAECRQLAEALRPLTSATHEQLPRLEQESLPQYRGGVRHPAPAMATVLKAGVTYQGHGVVGANRAMRSAGWPGGLPFYAGEGQVASFSLAPRGRTSTPLEALSMLLTLTVAAVAFWCLGVLAL